MTIGIFLGCFIGTLTAAWVIDQVIDKCSSNNSEHTVNDLNDIANKI